MTGVGFLDEKGQIITRFLDRDSYPETRGELKNSNGDANGKKCKEIEELPQQLNAWPWEVLH
jgi:hypothetical protein